MGASKGVAGLSDADHAGIERIVQNVGECVDSERLSKDFGAYPKKKPDLVGSNSSATLVSSITLPGSRWTNPSGCSWS